MNDFTSFGNTCGIIDGVHINLAAFDLAHIATCVSDNEYVKSAERDLQRYEFLEMIVRFGKERFVQAERRVERTSEGIVLLLEDLIYPNCKHMDGLRFRREYCYNVKSNVLLEKNEIALRRLYDGFTHPKQHYVKLDQLKAFVRRLGLRVSDMYVGAIYAESMQLITDTIRDPERPQMMSFVEFVVFLCRIAHEHYEGTPYSDELLYLKLEHLVPIFLNYHGPQATPWLYGEKFTLDAKADEKK